MVCKAKINSLQYLRNKNLINDINKILNEPGFDKMNEELTRYAEVKYGLNTEGKLLYAKKVVNQFDRARSTYYRDAKYTIAFAEPNEALFNELDKLIKYDDSRDSNGNDAQFYQLNDVTVLEKNIEDLDKYLLNFLKQFNVQSKEFDSLKERLGIDALGATDVLNKLIWYTKNRNVETVPEEVGHMVVMLMGPEHEAIKQLMKNITSWDEYDTVYQKYMPIYNNEQQVKIEAAGKIIAKSLVSNYKAVGVDKSLIQKVLKALEELIMKMVNSLPLLQTMNYNARIADHIALNVLAGNAEYISNLTETRPQLNYEEALRDNLHAQMIIDTFAKELGFPLVGSLAIAGQGEIIYRPSNEPIHDLDFLVDGTTLEKLEGLENKLDELNAVPVHFGWTNVNKQYTTYAYYIPAPGYTVEVLERNNTGWALKGKVILRDTAGNIVSPTADTLIPVDFFTYTDVMPSETSIDIFSSWNDIYAGKLSLSPKGMNERFFRREKDQKDYVNSNPINRNIKSADSFIYYQLNEGQVIDEDVFDPIKAVEVMELDVPAMQKARAKEMLDVITERLALGLQVSYHNISPEEATEILKDRPVPYTGQPGFYHAGTIYTVGENVSLGTTLHEFSHPLLGALRRENKELFNNLYNKLVATTEGEAIERYVKKKYPELLEGSDLFKEEVLAYGLQLKALNNINEQIATNGFDRFINLLLKAIKDMLKKIFGNKAVVSKLDVNTTLEELADMLLTKEFEYDTVMATKEDIVMYMKSVTEAAENLAKNASVKALQDGINRTYLLADGIIQRAKNFKKGTPEYEMLVQSVFMDVNKNKLIPEVKKSLAGFIDFGRTGAQSKDEIIDKALDAEQKRIKDLTNRATSFVNSLDVMNESAKYMFDNILEIQKNVGFVSRPSIALLSMYKVNNRAMAETIVNLDKSFTEDFGLGPGNPLYAMMSELTQNLVRNEELIKDVYKANTGKFYVEITGYMNDFLAEELKTNLQNALGKKMTEPEIQMLYNKVIQQSLTDEDIETLSKIPGVNMRYINQFIEKYNYFVTNEDKILDILSGNTKDVSIISRYLESYSTANDPVIGALAIWISDKKDEAQREAIKKAHNLRVKLEKLLPKVNFNPNNTQQIFNMVATEDEVFDIDKATGKPMRRTIGTLLSPHGNGWRHDKTELEYNLAQARESGDKKAIQKAQDELDTFIADYMWDKYLPEVYEKDKIFDEHPMGRQAWLDRKLIIEEMQSAISPVATELERFEKYSVMQALWKEYRQLYSLTYTDGSPKVDSPEDGIFDLTKAKILRKHREATRDYYEFVPIDGALQAAYNNFILQIQGQGIERGTEEFKEKLAEWEKQNINRIYSDKYYEAVAQNIKRLKELQSKVNEVIGQTIDVGVMYEEIYNLMFAFKDELGQPVPQELGEERLRKIRDIQQKIVNYKEQFDNKSGLTKEEVKELDFLKNAMRKQVALTDEQKIRYAKLDAKQQISGLSSSEIDEINDIYATLSDLRTTIPTDYYMEIMNTRLQDMNAAEIEPDKVDDFINSTEFAGILASNEEFAQWFYDNHVIRKVFDPSLGKKGKYIDKFERSRAWSVTIPSNPDHYLKTTVTDKETGEKIEFIGVPNARHSVFRVKDKYRTIPIDADYADYVGKVVDNKGEYLPRLYKPGDKYSAKTDKYMNKKYFELEAKKGPEWELLQAIKEYFLEVQKGKSGNSKLYLDIPRYSIKDKLEFIQTGLLQEKFDEFKGSLKYYFDRAFKKAADDNENGFNYDADNNLINTDLNGTEIGFVPVTGLYRLDFNVTSKDVFSSMFQYAMSIETQAKLIETLPLVQSIVETLEEPENAPKILKGWSKQYMKLTGEKRRASARNKKSQRAGQLRSLFEREYFGRKVVGLEENNIILSKLLNGLQSLSATSSLALNPSSDLKNRYGAIAQNIVEAAGGEFVDLKSLALGRLWAAKAMLDWSTKGIYAKGPQSLTTQLIMEFDPVFRTDEAFGRKSSVSRSMAKDLLNGSFLYDFRKFAEMEGALQLFGGFLDKRMINVTLSNGKTAQIKYADAWELDQDGYLKLKDGIDPEWSNHPVYHTYIEGESLDAIAKRYHTTVESIRKKNKLEEGDEIKPGSELIIATSEKFKRFKNEFAGTSHLLYGAYDAFAQPEGDQYMIYRMFFFMRKWATPMFVNKWGAEVDTSEGIGKMKIRERYNWELGQTRMGYYTKTLQTIYELVKSKGDKYNHMTNSEKVALKKTFADTLQMIIYALIVGMLFGYDADDDERWEKLKARSGPLGTPEFKGYGFLANHTMLLLLGVQAETSAFLPLPKIGGVQFGLDDYSKFFTQTSTAFGNTITLYAKILQDIFNTVTMDESALYKRDSGPYWFKQKDVNKIWSHLFRTVGFTGGTGDPITLLKNLEQSSSKIG